MGNNKIFKFILGLEVKSVIYDVWVEGYILLFKLESRGIGSKGEK